MTEFQKRIVEVLHKFPNGMAGTWEIAQEAFPEKWANRSGRGALIAQITKAGDELERRGEIYCVLPAQDQFRTAKLCANR